MAKSRRPSFSQDSLPPPEAVGEEQASPVIEEAPEPVSVDSGLKAVKLVANKCNLLEPYENIWFLDGKPREVYRVTKWIQAQIDAGLLKKV